MTSFVMQQASYVIFFSSLARGGFFFCTILLEEIYSIVAVGCQKNEAMGVCLVGTSSNALAFADDWLCPHFM